MSRQSNIGPRQDGFASLIVALVLILVMALITIGFAQLGRREQQTALNSQLGAQAFYAVESGINDAKQFIANRHITPIGVLSSGEKNNCTALKDNLYDPKLNPTTDTVYSCVLMDDQPLKTEAKIEDGTSWTTSFQPVNNAGTAVALNQLTMDWNYGAGLRELPQAEFGKLPPPSEWVSPVPIFTRQGVPAVLQVSITALPNNGSADRKTLIGNTYTAYLYPIFKGPGTANFTPGGSPAMIAGYCVHDVVHCLATITIPSTPYDSSYWYLVHVTAFYAATTLQLSSSPNVHFNHSQAVIDATGRVRNVVKRVKVHVDLSNTSNQSPNALEGQNICKRFNTAPGTPGSTDFIDPSGTNVNASATSSCRLDN